MDGELRQQYVDDERALPGDLVVPGRKLPILRIMGDHTTVITWFDGQTASIVIAVAHVRSGFDWLLVLTQASVLGWVPNRRMPNLCR